MNNLYSWDFTLANYDSVWKFMVVVGILLISLLIGNILRNVVPFLRKGLIPSALIGGLVLMIVNLLLKLFHVELITEDVRSILQVITYHGLGIGFVAMTLKSNKKTKEKGTMIKAVEVGALTGGSYLIQAAVGILITVVFFLVTKGSTNEIFYTSGVILPLGFGQGPGNALTWDVNFSNIVDANGTPVFQGNGSFGLSIASIGFIVASVIGVIYINVMRRKGLINTEEVAENKRELEEFEGENEIPDNESVDKFSIQMGFVAIGYAIAFGIMCIFAVISDFTNGIAWGFNFLWGVIAAILIKQVLNLLKKTKVIKRDYINNYQMDRISGFAFDIMIVAGVAAIEIDAIKRYIWPLVALCVAGTIITYLYVRIVSKYVFPEYQHEMFVMNFGALTGTASNGMILLKEIDPNLKTPVSNLFVAMQLPAMIMVAPLLLLLNFASKSFMNTIIAMIIFFVLFIAYTIFLFRKKIFKSRKRN